jgi:ATP-dependent helicase/nuclease subunit B
MLTLRECSSPLDKLQFLTSVRSAEDLRNITWLVSDLRNKFEIQRHFADQFGGFEDLTVYRASELWRYLFKQAFPFHELVTKDFVRALVREEILLNSTEVSQNSDQLIVNFLEEMAPIFIHPEGFSQLQQFLSSRPAAVKRWGKWATIAHAFYTDLEKKNRVPVSAVPSFLLYNLPSTFKFERRVIVDLSHHLSKEEAELLLRLSAHTEVLVLMPQFLWLEKYPHLLAPYRRLKEMPSVKFHAAAAQSAIGELKLQFLKFTTPLAECKQVTHQVRAWAELGVPLDKISLIAPDMESYWSILQPLLQLENIPVNKDVVHRLSNFPYTRKWLAKLKMLSRSLSFGDLQSLYFEPLETPAFRFEDFFGLFSQLMDSEDLKRHPEIEKAFMAQAIPDKALSRDEALGHLLKHWPKTDELEGLDRILRLLLADSWSSLQFHFSTWLFLVEQFVQRAEVRQISACIGGVELANLTAAESIFSTHRIYMGLTENAMQEKSISVIYPQEIFELEKDLGFYLTHPEQSALEFDLQWQLQGRSQNNSAETQLLVCLSDMQGQVQAPSKTWMKMSGRFEDATDLPSETVYDSKQANLQFPLPLSEPVLNPHLPKSLSASALEKYAKCPFIYKAERIFSLRDPEVVDLDPDHRQTGQLMHALLEKLSEEPRRYNHSEADLAVLIEELRGKVQLPFLDPQVWAGIKRKYVALALRFLQFEKSWFQQFPKSKIVGRELGFEFQLEKMQFDVKFRGKVDRIETDGEGHFAIVDYKSSAVAGSIDKLIEQGKLQLFLYALALEAGGVENLEAGEVLAAVYFDTKKMDRRAGFRCVDNSKNLLSVEDSKQNRLSAEKKISVLESAKARIGEMVTLISEQQFDPKPRDNKDCNTCDWRGLCRAPHLN